MVALTYWAWTNRRWLFASRQCLWFALCSVGAVLIPLLLVFHYDRHVSVAMVYMLFVSGCFSTIAERRDLANTTLTSSVLGAAPTWCTPQEDVVLPAARQNSSLGGYRR